MSPRTLSLIALLLAGCSSSAAPPGPTPTPQPAGLQPLAAVDGVPELVDTNPDPHIVEVKLWAEETTAEIRAGTSTKVMAFNGSVPGPLLHARAGDRVIVHFENRLREATTIHWHGLRIRPEMDGNPLIVPPIEPGATFTYDFVVPDAGTFWYHPHTDSIEQVERGLYAPIVVAEKDAPAFSRERMLVLDDVRLDSAAQIAAFGSPSDMMMGRYGNTLLVNGKAVPGAGPSIAAGAIERWRLVNSAGVRPMEVSVEGGSFRVVATDGGLLPEAYTTARVTVAIGQRYDLEVTADDPSASSVRLIGHVLVSQSDGSTKEQAVVLFEAPVDGESKLPAPVYPTVTLPDLPDAPAVKGLRLGMTSKPSGEMVMTINGKDGRTLAMLEVAQNAPVRFNIVNDDHMHLHPFHFHGQFFQIVARDGKPANEPGLKDTVLVDPASTVSVVTYFENPGEWMYHCHIPEHAMQGMMAELRVTPAN